MTAPTSPQTEKSLEVQNAIAMMEKIRKGEVITPAERLYQILELACAYQDECETMIAEFEGRKAENAATVAGNTGKGLLQSPRNMLAKLIGKKAKTSVAPENKEGKDQLMYLIRGLANIQARPKQPH